MKKTLCLIGSALVTAAVAHAQTNPPPRPVPQAQISSPEVHPDRTVTFRLRATNAASVIVSGEFRGSRRSMAKDERGVWSITVGPVEPDIYQYSFSVDGLWMLDPENPVIKPMRTPTMSLVEVPADTPQVWDYQPVPHGAIRLHQYDSKVRGKLLPLRVYTPPGYDKNPGTKYPTLYLFHGLGDSEGTWTGQGRAHYILDNLIAQGKAKPMVIVMPEGHASFAQPPASDTNPRARSVAAFEQDLFENIMPFVEDNYRVKAGPENRAITGLSMGGGQALTIGLRHPDVFAWVGGMSSAMINTNYALTNVLKDVPAANKSLKLVWFGCGTSDSLLRSNQQFDDALTQAGIKHEFHTTEGAHTWPVWRRNLSVFSPLMFAEK